MYKLTACSLTLIYYIVFIVSGVAYGEPCKSFKDCECVLANNSVINLKPITKSDGSPRYIFLPVEGADKNETIYFFYNLCFKFHLGSGFPDRNGKNNCTDAFGCKLVIQKDENLYPYQERIISSNATVIYNSSEINYKDNESKLKISLNCDPKSNEAKVEIAKKAENDYNLAITSKCACADVCKSPDPVITTTTSPSKPTTSPSPSPSKSESKLSTGSVLLIIFFTFLAIYIFGGIMWNAFCLGATGIEMLPNLEFWKEFPALVIEGARFSSQCCKTPTTYDGI